MTNKTYGYIRISSKDQNYSRQLSELQKCDISDDCIFIDIASGKDFNREQYINLRNILQQGDLLIIKSIDRLGRNYSDILQEWREITKNIKANIKVLDMPLLDTTLTNQDLTGLFISDLVLQILSYVAQQERENIKQRQKEGIALAKLQGKQFGRPRATYPEQFDDIYIKWKSGDITANDAMRILGLKRTTFYKLVQKYKENITNSQIR